MVCVCAVKHPADWVQSGYNEIQSLPQRYRCIDVATFATLLGIIDADRLRSGLRAWVDLALVEGNLHRQPARSQSIAVGQREYLHLIWT